MNNKSIQTITVIAIAAFLVVLYLFALNGRYAAYNDGTVIDKWTQKLIICEEVEAKE